MSATAFQGKTAAITGAVAGIGRAIAELFAARGARLALLDTNVEVDRLAASLGPNNAGYRVDVSDEKAVEAAFAEIGRAFGGADIVINNAGIGIIEPADKLSVAAWDKTLAVNLRGPFLCARAAVPFMFEKRWGRIIRSPSSRYPQTMSPVSKASLCMTNGDAISGEPTLDANCDSPSPTTAELGLPQPRGKEGKGWRAEVRTAVGAGRRLRKPLSGKATWPDTTPTAGCRIHV